MISKAQRGFRIIVSIIFLSIFSISPVLAEDTASIKSGEVTNNSVQKDNTKDNTTVVTDNAVQKDNVQKDNNIEVVADPDADTTVLPELEADETAMNKDPLERFNRAMFMFNDKLDYYLIKPIAQLYNAIIPKPLNKGIHNFFNNLGEVPTIVNDLLQVNLYQMAKDTTRLTINTTIGIGGLFDIATRMHYPYFQNDFGLTLARWGYKSSSYLVLPFLGSNTIRDGVFGIPVDYFEFSVYPYVTPQSRRYQLLALFMIDHRANLLQFEPVLDEAAIDRYVFMRNAYMQHRAFQIEQVKHLSYKERDKNSDDATDSSLT